MSLRTWLMTRTDDELAALVGTRRFSTDRNRRVLNAVRYERAYGPLPDSVEDDAPINTRIRSAFFQQAARALLEEKHFDGHDSLDFAALVPRLVAQTGCHPDTAKRHLAKAARILRGESAPAWGGPRPGAGRPTRRDP